MEIEIVARETIKPFCPTPKHLRNFKLSLLDQTAPAMYTPILLFYSASADTDRHDQLQADQRSQHLKTSLSKMLTQFYPLAGIIKDQNTIECTDDGAEYVEARVNCLLSDILQQPDASVRSFLPVETECMEAETGRLLFVQANFFECGGVVIGVCVSHKIADGSTLGTVIKSWSAAAIAGSSTTDAAPVTAFDAASFFPPVLDSPITPMKMMIDKCAVSKRFVFESKKITDLKARGASATVQQPSRVEAVTALIWKCMIHVSRSMNGFPRLSLISHAVNLRKKCVPPLPENSIGNTVGFFFSSYSTENEIDLKGLVCILRKELAEFNKTALQTINQEKKTWLEMCRIGNFAIRDDVDYRIFSSWCRFPFYEADFGWGKPTRAAFPNSMFKNSVLLMDTREEGIEALVTLSKEEMVLLEHELEVLLSA